MGIEAIGGIGRVASMAPAIASVGRSVSFGLSLGRVSMPVPEVGFSVTRIANPFIKAPTYIENKVPSLLGPAIDVIKNPALSVIAPRSIEGRAPRYDVRVRTPEPAIVRLPNPTRGLDIRVLSNPLQAPKVQPEAQTRIQPKTESNPGPGVRRTVFPAPSSRVQTEQVKEERLKVEQKQEEKGEKRKSGKTSVVKIKFSEAVEISQKRAAALKKAYQEIKTKGLSIKLLRAFLSRSYWEAISPIAQKGHDGTLNLTVSELEKQKYENPDETKADQAIYYAVSNHIPVQKGEGGRPVTIEEVREVLEGKEKETTKSQALAEIVVTRVVRKKVNTMVEEKEEVTGEPTLKSLGLEELFPKAA